MAAVRVQRSRWLPAVYPLVALAVGVALLPSALHPPPEQTSDSAALNPNAPPDENQEQVIQAVRQAQGGAAGEATDITTTTTTPPNPPLASNLCIGNPARQTESVYSASCAPAFRGNNGGVTSPNVFANEVRWGFWHTLGMPPGPGRIDDMPANASASTRTFQTLEKYFNKRFEFYGRKIRFYALKGSTEPAANQAEAKKAGEEYRTFGATHLDKQFCTTFTRRYGPVICQPEAAEVYTANRPNFFSFMVDRTTATGFGAEFACKKLIGKVAKFSGTEKDKVRKISVVAENYEGGGLDPAVYERALKAECNATYGGKSYSLDSGNATVAAAGAVTQMRNSGVTSVIVETNVVNLVNLMASAAAIGWEPEWIIVNAYGLDFNTIGTILPTNEASHLFGLSAWEVPRRFEETECYQAYKEIDPDNDPDSTVCQLFWHPMVLIADGIQNAGPRLTPVSFQDGLFKLGHRFPAEPWAIGGGFGPGDYSYMDNVGEVWFSLGAVNPENGAPGAYVWSYGAKRFKRGELPTDDGQLFAHGVTTPGGPDINS